MDLCGSTPMKCVAEIKRLSSQRAIEHFTIATSTLRWIVKIFGTRCLKASSLLLASHSWTSCQISSPKDWVDFLMDILLKKLGMFDICAPFEGNAEKTCS